MENKAQKFLNTHELSASHIDMGNLSDLFLSEMKNGLEGKKSSLIMIPTYIEVKSKLAKNEPVIAIDAGGTNFRTAKVLFDDNMNLITEKLETKKMPAVDKHLTKEEFFHTMAGYMKDYINDSEKIGLCFSYAVEIFPDKDGKLLEWSKEIKAPDVIGEMIGKNLLDAMGTPGKQIVLLNDTVATLLAGHAAASGEKYDTYIGFILGTGTNTCYIESNNNISKKPNLDPEGSQVINIESGNFAKVPQSDIDKLFDSTTKNPGRYTFEKMFAGGYFGGLCTTAIKVAAKEKIFTHETQNSLINLPELTTEEVNKFVSGIDMPDNPLGKILSTEEDKTLAMEIIDGMIERAAKLVAINLGSVILKTGKGKNPDKPVLMTIEGTTFYKLNNFQKMFESFLKDFLSKNNKRYYEIVEVENSSLVGAAIAAIVN
jgi:hexokinase